LFACFHLSQNETKLKLPIDHIQILKEQYSKHEVLLAGEMIKMTFSAWMISGELPANTTTTSRIVYLTRKSSKMFLLAFLYGSMNILSYVALQYISAATFTILAQCKILTTAAFSALMLRRQYSSTKWRALVTLMLGVLLFSAPILDSLGEASADGDADNMFLQMMGTAAVLLEVTLSGFASIYFEKVIKVDPEKLTIWERNFQLALWSCPIYIIFMVMNGGGALGYGGGWSPVAVGLALIGAAGGLLVALSIKYGDAILKTLAVTGSIILSSLLDHYLLGGPLTIIMCIAGAQVVLSICNYTFDATQEQAPQQQPAALPGSSSTEMAKLNPIISKV
jgi:UDP-sugar transporter A1/2/3